MTEGHCRFVVDDPRDIVVTKQATASDKITQISADSKLLQLRIRSMLYPDEGPRTTKTWRTRPQESKSGACEKCLAMEGETVAVDEPYSNGMMSASECHPNGKCFDEFN